MLPKGVSAQAWLDKNGGLQIKYHAYLQCGKRQKHLGFFHTWQEAEETIRSAKQKAHYDLCNPPDTLDEFIIQPLTSD